MAVIETVTEVMFLDDRAGLTAEELAQASGLSREDIQALVDLGVLEPQEAAGQGMVFAARTLTVTRTARRLKHDFELDATGLALALSYLERIEELEQELRQLQCHLPR